MRIAASLLLSLLLVFSSAFAESPGDLSALSTKELRSLLGDVLLEYTRRAAEEEGVPSRAEAEITFRDLPWGCSVPDLKAHLQQSGHDSKTYRDDCPSWETKPAAKKLQSRFTLEDGGFRVVCDEAMTVAGYPVTGIEARFCYTFDAEQLYTDADRSSMYMAKYTFDPSHPETAFNQLQAKLTVLYGEGEKKSFYTNVRSNAEDYLHMNEWVVWYGANDTAVLLQYSYVLYYSDPSLRTGEQIFLIYGKSNSITLLNELQSAIAREEAENAAASFDGL